VEKPFTAYRGDEPYVFVCYAHEDANAVYPILSQLHSQGTRVWYDEGVSPGLNWRDEVAKALVSCDVVLFFVTPKSVISSNCLKELNFALSRERRILVTYLEPTELPPGLELSLSDVQAVIRGDHQFTDYILKLSQGLVGSAQSVPERPTLPATELGESSTPDRTAIAVLPFLNRSSDPDNDYLCEGIAETLTSGLSAIDGLKVASQLSASTFRGRNVDVKAVGAALSVGAVVSGAVQKSGERLRIRVALDSVRDAVTLWSQQYDMVLADIFDVQDDVARKVVDALKVELKSVGKARLLKFGTENPEAYNAFMLGNYECQRFSHRGLNRAINFYQQAVALDDSLADAHGRLGLCCQALTSFGVPRDDVIELASASFARARELGFSPYGTRLWNGVFYTWDDINGFLSDSAIAGEQYTQHRLTSGIAMLCDPDDPRVLEDPVAGVIELRAALVNLRLFKANYDLLERYSDESHPYHYEIGDALATIGRLDEAISRFSAALAEDPQHHFARNARALAYVRVGELTRAAEDMKILNQVWPKSFFQFLHYYWNGEVDTARNYFVTNFADHPRFEIRLKVVAWTMLGEFEEALVVLNTSTSSTVEPIPYNLVLYAPQHCVDGLLREPGYIQWLERFGLSDVHREQARRLLNEISHITGVTVSEP
jgi:TolB-like protein